MKRLEISLLMALIYTSSCTGFSLLPSNYNKMPAQEAIELLQEKQINNPNDPIVNYNLGVALYKQKKYDQANTNFDRAVNNSTTPELRKKALFNQGNCFYSNTLEMLGDDWENKNLDPKILETASTQITGAIDKFKRALSFDKNNERIQNNLKVSEELAKKLQKKKQQEQQKQDQKKEQEKQEKQEQDKNKQEQDQNKQQDDKQKQDQDKNKQEQDKQEQNKNKEEQDKNKQQDDKQKQEQDNKQKQDKQEQDQNKKEQAKQEKSQDKKQESLKTKNMRVRLENLQQDENSTQKKLMQMQSAQQMQPQSRGQKPW